MIRKSFYYQYFKTTRIKKLIELYFALGDWVTVLHITFIVWWCCTTYGETDHDSKNFNTNDKFLWHKYVTHYFFAGNKKLTCPWFLEQFSRTYSMYTAEYFTQFSVVDRNDVNTWKIFCIKINQVMRCFSFKNFYCASFSTIQSIPRSQ